MGNKKQIRKVLEEMGVKFNTNNPILLRFKSREDLIDFFNVFLRNYTSQSHSKEKEK